MSENTIRKEAIIDTKITKFPTAEECLEALKGTDSICNTKTEDQINIDDISAIDFSSDTQENSVVTHCQAAILGHSANFVLCVD